MSAKWDAKSIETWALANKDRARKLGEALVKMYMGGKVPTMGLPEDEIIAWAGANRLTAMSLFMKLQSQIAK